MAKLFVLYDGRAKIGCPEDCEIFCVASSEEEAKQDGKDLFDNIDAIWFEYDVIGDKLFNGIPRYDLPPNQKE